MDFNQEEYERLKADYLQLTQKLENSNQELHESKRNIKVLESLQADYQHEIDMLQTEEIRQKQRFQEIIKQLELDMDNMRDNQNDEIQMYKNDIMKLELKNEQMKSELDDYKESYHNDTNFVGDTSTLINDILSESPEFYELKENLKESQETNNTLERQIKDYQDEIHNLKEILLCTKADLKESTSTIQFLNDKILCLNAEVDSLKNQPLNKDSKGNSLFAEVNDRRVYLQDKINKMKGNYVAITQEKAQLLNSVHHLKLENMRILEKWKLAIERQEDDDHKIKASLRSRINTLEKLIEQYKKDLQEKPLVIKSEEDRKIYNSLLQKKSDEIQALRDEINLKSTNLFILSSELKQSNDEKRKWQLEAMSIKHQLELLQVEMSADLNKKESDEINNGTSKQNHQRSNINDYESARNSEYRVSSTPGFQEEMPEADNTLKDITNNTSSGTDFKDFETTVAENDKNQHNNSNKFRDSVTVKENDTICKDKWSMIQNVTQTRKVTFAENTLSPKKTGRIRRTIRLTSTEVVFND